MMDFVKMEEELLATWKKENLVAQYLKKNQNSKKRFSFLDGPITANNPMGVHHAWGRTLKDLYQRYKNMQGFRSRFQNGFDCQGLWVEVEVEKELGLKTKKDIENLVPGDRDASIAKFVELCKERVLKFAGIQTEQSKRLGSFMDWDNSYFTMSTENNETIWAYLQKCHEKGWLYKGRDSVPWCPRCGTAISQHEILTEEYKLLTHRTLVFKLPLLDDPKTSLLAWTTTPWTIPGNVALAVDKKMSYWKMRNEEGESIILVNPTSSDGIEARDMLVNRFKLTDGWTKTEEVKGASLVGLPYVGPFDDLPAVKKTLSGYTHRVIATNERDLPINPSEGTGIVHIAPGAGTEDFKLGVKENIPAIEEIAEDGIFLEGFAQFSGQPTNIASKMILEELVARGVAFKVIDYTHRYPTCWRCKTELVWRVVDEWYIAMDKKDSTGRSYREQMKEVALQIEWIPSWGKERELDWLSNMHDWLISKKRYWGLALPIWECQHCKKFEVIGTLEELKERAVEGWNEFDGHTPHRPWVDKVKIACSNCSAPISRIPDVGNPWLDAGIVPYSTLHYLSDPAYWQKWFPADFVTESFPGQFKNWFYSLIAMSTVMTKKPPFRTLLGYASVRDDKGSEMHKSKGNAIELNEAASMFGADVMRWLYARQNVQHNVNFGPVSIGEVRRRFYLLYWNTFRFFNEYAQTASWKPKKELPRTLTILDVWILTRLNQTVDDVTSALDRYDNPAAVASLELFVSDLSTWYVRRSRDRVSPASEDAADKNLCFQVLHTVFETLTRMTAPMIPFLSDEMYRKITGRSVHLEEWPVKNSFSQENLLKASKFKIQNSKLLKQMNLIRQIASMGHAQRKEKKIPVRQPLPAVIVSGILKLDHAFSELLQMELNVKSVEWRKGKELSVDFDWTLTDELKKEGEAREIIRQIQQARKEAGVGLSDRIMLTLPAWPKEYEDLLKRETLSFELKHGDHLTVVKK
ncbi:MAG: isoleucine--tRNA ligase [bacterium]|nr:isoleucine--tRNA ligase [bacterium]